MPIQELMDSEELKRFYPMNLLKAGELDALAAKVQILEYLDEDYVYRLGEEPSDLLYVLDGTVQVMDIEKRTNVFLSSSQSQSSRPFTHEVPAAAVAVAKPKTRVLKVDFELLSQLLPSEQQVLNGVRPSRHREPEPEPEIVAASEPEYLEIPEDMEQNIRLLMSDADDAARKRKARKAVKEKAVEAESKPQSAQPVKSDGEGALQKVVTKDKIPARAQPQVPAKVPVSKTAAKAVPQVQPRPAPEKTVTKTDVLPPGRKSVGDMLSDLKVILSSDITLQPKRRKTRPVKVSKPVSLYDEEVTPQLSNGEAADKSKRKTMTDLLAGAKEILYSDIKLMPRQAEEAETLSLVTEEEPGISEQLSDAEFKEIETREYLRAMSLFREQKWDSAHAAFKALYAANPRTNLYRTYANRCQENLAGPATHY